MLGSNTTPHLMVLSVGTNMLATHGLDIIQHCGQSML